MQKTIENGVTVLTADEGMKLTNGQSFGSVVRLGVKDREDNWCEITQAEAEQRMAELEAEEELAAEQAFAELMEVLT